MKVAEIRFDDEREGIVPVGTILADAARRLGVDLGDCSHPDSHVCEVTISKGSEHLSKPGESELELLGDLGKGRFACFVKIEGSGEIVVMSTKKQKAEKEPVETDDRDESYRKEFVEMPLEKKIANLIQLEAITVSETLAYVINSPFTVFDKIGDVLAEFGFNKEAAEKEQKRAAAESQKENKSAKKKQKSQSEVEQTT
jgi:ferredoxin